VSKFSVEFEEKHLKNHKQEEEEINDSLAIKREEKSLPGMFDVATKNI